MSIDRLPIRFILIPILAALACVTMSPRAHAGGAPAAYNVCASVGSRVGWFVEEGKPGERLVALRSTIDSCIAMLEAKDYVTFLERVIHPDDRERYAAKGGYEELAKEFAGEKADVLLSVLKYVRTRTPKFTERETVATFKLGKGVAPRGTIAFVSVAKVWYLKN